MEMAVETRKKCPPSRVDHCWQDEIGNYRPDLKWMIDLYSWRRCYIDVVSLSRLSWVCFPNDKEHISNILTEHGQKRTVGDVAEKYLILKEKQPSEPTIAKISEMIEALDRGVAFPPLIVVPGCRYQDAPDSSFVDGAHRSVALVAHSMQLGGEVLTRQEVFLGKKYSAPYRLALAVARLF